MDHPGHTDSYSDHSQVFSKIRQLLAAPPSPTVSQGSYRASLNILDYLILGQLYHGDFDVKPDAEKRSRALTLAAHVFVYVTLRRVPPKSPLVRRMCTRLQNMEGLAPSSREIWSECSAALLWIAFAGLLGTWTDRGACPEGQWFLGLFQATVQGYPQDFSLNGGSLRETLSKFPWDDHYCLPLLADLEARLGAKGVQTLRSHRLTPHHLPK